MTEAMNLFSMDKAFLNQKAVESGFIRDNLEKVYRLTDVLSFINEDPVLSEYLVLKGGTAINLTVFDLPRLSVDIDLDLDRKCPREEMLKIREKIGDILQRYMIASGYSLNDRRNKDTHSLVSWVFHYQSAGGNSDNIKIEINYSMRQHILPAHQAAVEVDFIETPLRVKALAPLELFGSKIKALTERAAARDLYDIHNMIRFGVFDESEMDLLRKCALFYRAVGSTEHFHEGIDLGNIDRLTFPIIRQTLLPVLRRGERVDLETMKANVKSFVSELLIPTADEQAFLHEFSMGNYEPSLLFDDVEILDRIEDHPMAIWKCGKTRQAQEQKPIQGWTQFLT